MKKILSSGLAIGAMISFVGCGGGSSSSGATIETISGKFIDAAVKGLKYVTATQEGYTDENGSFDCVPGEQATFSIGTLELGTAECGVLITPYAFGDTAGHIAYLLQNLDANKSNSVTIDVSNFKDFDFSDVNLSAQNFDFQNDILDAYKDANISDLLDQEDTTIIGQGAAVNNMDAAIADAENDLKTELANFVTGKTFTVSGIDIPSGTTVSFEANGRYIDYDAEDFAEGINCDTSWKITSYNTIQVGGEGEECALSLKIIGTPEDGVSFEANVTDEIPEGELFTGTLTTVGTALKEFVTGKDFGFDEQSEVGIDFDVSLYANGVYEDFDKESSELCQGEWIAIANDTIAVANCGLKIKFPTELVDGMTITATAQDPGQPVETFTGTLTEYK